MDENKQITNLENLGKHQDILRVLYIISKYILINSKN